MIVRHYVVCGTCGHALTLRIQMGGEKQHDHHFDCPKCSADIAVRVTAENAFNISIDCLANCKPSAVEGQVVNLAADFLIPKEHLHSDKYFPAMEHMHRIFDHLSPEEIERNAENTAKMLQLFKSADDAGTPRPPVGLTDDWALIKRAWRFMDRGNEELATKQLEQYIGDGYTGNRSFYNILFNFAQRLIMPRSLERLSQAVEQLKPLSELPGSEYDKFVAYYDGKLRAEHLARYHDLLLDFFRDFDEFNQTLIYAKLDIALPAHLVARSTGFARTRMFYGNAFETHGSNMVVLACLNNIRKGRGFDQFEKMDLKQYMTINKAGRANPFVDFSPFAALTSEYDSNIRNASHHGWFKLDRSGETLEYRSGGTGALRRLPYAEYLLRCDKLFCDAMALLCLELIIASTSGLIG
jgi:hypothetical protein